MVNGDTRDSVRTERGLRQVLINGCTTAKCCPKVG